MKTGLSILIPAVTTALILSSCGRTGVGDLVTFDYSRMKKGHDTLAVSELAMQPEFIALDSDTVDAFAYGSIIVTDNYIVRNAEAISMINKAPVRVFDRHTGRFICNVGHLGRGPGEYLNSYCTFVDEEGGKVWIMNAGDHIKTYDLLSGKYIGDVPLAHEVREEFGAASATFSVDPDAGTVTVAAIPYEEDSNPSIAWCQDMEGNIVWDIPKDGRERSRKQTNSLIRTTYNVEGLMDVYIHGGHDMPDTLYVLSDGVLSPVFTYDERSLKSGMSLSSTLLPGKVLSHLTEEQETIPNVRVSMPTAMVITDLKSGESVRYGLVMRNDFLGVDAGGGFFQYGYMIQQISAEEFRETGQQALEQGLLSGSAAGQVRAILADLKDTDNDVIMLARLKD